MKRLKDYPLHEWIEAADGCYYCGAKNEVMVLHVDKSGDFGDVQIRCHHERGCAEWTEEDAFDIAGWVFSHVKVEISGEEFPTLRSRVNIGPCMRCWKIIGESPIILFPCDGEYETDIVEIDFCKGCFDELGLKP